MEPESPCIKLCELGPDDICRGCGRSLDEIGQWSQVGAAQRRAIRERARERLQKKDEK